MPYLNANGVRLHLQRLGEGPPLVMLHGLLIGSLASWYFTAAPALARQSSVLLYDLRGHGRSERVALGYDSDTMVVDLEAVTEELPEPITLVGHSYGAVVALKFALRHPHRVARLALVEAPLPPSAAGEVNDFLALEPAQMLQVLPDSVKSMFAGRRRAAGRLLKNLHYLATQSSLIDDLRAETDIADETLAALQCPVLLVYGTQSPCREVGVRLSRALPRAELVLLDGGHNLPLEATQALTECLTGFCHG